MSIKKLHFNLKLICALLTICIVPMFFIYTQSTQYFKQTKIVSYKQVKIPSSSKNGSCWTTSNVASGNATAYRCMSGNNIYDPCFTTASNKVVCGVTPFDDTKGFELKLTEPLTNNSEPNNQSAFSNWIVELENGARCTKFSGTAGSIPNDDENEPIEMYYYTCNDDGVVVGSPELIDNEWKVKIAYINTKPIEHKVLSVTKMWK